MLRVSALPAAPNQAPAALLRWLGRRPVGLRQDEQAGGRAWPIRDAAVGPKVANEALFVRAVHPARPSRPRSGNPAPAANSELVDRCALRN